MVLVLTVLCGLALPARRDRRGPGRCSPTRPTARSSSATARSSARRCVGQTFTAPEYFHPRPSAAGALASGSLVDGEPADPPTCRRRPAARRTSGPTNPTCSPPIEERAAAYREANGLADDVAGPDRRRHRVGLRASTPTSRWPTPGSRPPRVADERGLPVDEVLALVDDHTDGRSLGFLGEQGVNVLRAEPGPRRARRD